MISIRPDAYYVSVLDIDARDLVARGYRAVLLDLSNSARERTVEAARVLDVYLVRNAMKPFARGYVRACAALGVPCDRAVMIGDQSYTDVLGAHRIGMDAVLVAPQPGSDPLHTHILRVLDRRAVRGMRAIGSMS